MLEKLKMILADALDEDTTDALLNLYLDIAKQKVLDRLYPFDNTKLTIPTRYEFKQIEIAQYLYLKRGAEGQVTHNENGINRTYENADVPESLMRGIVPYCGLPTKVGE